MSGGKLLAAAVLFLMAFNFMNVIHSELEWGTFSVASSAVVQAVGFTGLVLSSECTATRNPILESVCGCLGDLPAGYCYHLSCALVGIPISGNVSDQIAVIHRK